MNELMSFNSYQEYKQEFDGVMERTADSFVKIGYMLKQARDTDILKETKYGLGIKNYVEFAKQEYGIDKTVVSRFIRINDRFGNGPELCDEYKGFGYTKLSLMLQLPDEINKELTDDLSKQDIQDIKSELDEEKKTTDLEVYMEEEPKVIKEEESLLSKTMRILLMDEPELYCQLHDTVKHDPEKIALNKLNEILAQGETKVFMVRIPGIGRIMMSIKGVDYPIVLVNMRSGSRKEFAWELLREQLETLMVEEDAKGSWSKLYNLDYPKKQEVAPVQPTKKETKKVSKAKVKPKQEEPKVKVEEKPKEPLGEQPREPTNVPKNEPISVPPAAVENHRWDDQLKELKKLLEECSWEEAIDVLVHIETLVEKEMESEEHGPETN